MKMYDRVTLALAAGGALLAMAVASPEAHAQPLQEDDPGWSCVDAGNHVCGPDSDDWGHTPGCYDDGGVMVAPWPCYVKVDPITGEGDVYVP